MDVHGTNSVLTEPTFARMQTPSQHQISKNAHERTAAFRRLGQQLGSAPSPEGFAWAAVLIRRAAGIAQPTKELQRHLADIGREAG